MLLFHINTNLQWEWQVKQVQRQWSSEKWQFDRKCHWTIREYNDCDGPQPMGLHWNNTIRREKQIGIKWAVRRRQRLCKIITDCMDYEKKKRDEEINSREGGYEEVEGDDGG